MSDDLCSGFLPQSYLADRCKRCFRTKNKHGTQIALPNRKLSQPSAVQRHMTWRERVYGKKEADKEDDNDDAKSFRSMKTDEDGESVSGRRSRRSSRSGENDDVISYRSARSNDKIGSEKRRSLLSASTSFESLTDARTNTDDERLNAFNSRASTPTDHLAESDQNSALKAKLDIAEQKCIRLEAENVSLRNTVYNASASINELNGGDSVADRRLKQLEERLSLSESMFHDYRDENAMLKAELRELQESMGRDTSSEAKALRDKLKAAEQLCEEYIDENEALKREIQDLQHEIDEANDQYREDDVDEFRELRRDLEQTAKNCRVLQFKLRKTERQKEEAEAEQKRLEDRLREMTSPTDNQNALDYIDSRRKNELESELRIAKEVSVRLHTELEALEEKRYRLEDENYYLKNRIREYESRERLADTKQQRANEAKILPPSVAEHSKIQRSPSGNSYNIDHILRDLNDAQERETDLRDQLKFAEEDANSLRKKLADLETENEGFLKQLSKLTQSGKGASGRHMMRSYSEGQSQIHLELAEHENQVLKSKLAKVEKDSENMASKINLMERQVQRQGGRTNFTERELTAALPDMYYKQKIKILEEEVEEYKHKVEEARRAELEASYFANDSFKFGERERRKKPMGRSQSLDEHSDSESALKSARSVRASSTSKDSTQTQYNSAILEQELQNLRSKNIELEREMQRLAEENKKLKVMQRGNKNELRDKCDEMQRDIDTLLTKIKQLEKTKECLSAQNEKLRAETTIANSSVPNIEELIELKAENERLTKTNKAERNRIKSIEAQLADYRQVLLNNTDSGKLVAMASKVEQLREQLRESNNRYSTIHERMLAKKNKNADSYEDILKERCETLERELAGVKAASNFVMVKSLINSDSDEKLPIEEILGRTTKLHEDLSKLDLESSRLVARQSPNPTVSMPMRAETKQALLKDVDQMRADLHLLLSSLRQRKISPDSDFAGSDSSPQFSVDKSDEINVLRRNIDEMKRQNDKLKEEAAELKKQIQTTEEECFEAKNTSAESKERLLKTEEHWSKEVEQLKENYHNQINELQYTLRDAEAQKNEHSSALDERHKEIERKQQRIDELEAQVANLQNDIKTKYRDLQERIDVERKRANEFETKYQKIETLSEQERMKNSKEKERLKSEVQESKKRYDTALSDKDKIKMHHENQAKAWADERQALETRVTKLQTEITAAEKKLSKLATVDKKIIADEANKTKGKLERDLAKWKSDYEALKREVEAKARAIEARNAEEQTYMKEIETLKNRIDEQRQQLQESRRARDESKEELQRWQTTWARERSDLSHKLRQEEKVQQAEQQTMQLKFESRMKIQEESMKNLHSQLARARRDRDQFKEQMLVAEKSLNDLTTKSETDQIEYHERATALTKANEEIEDLKTRLRQLNHKHDEIIKEHKSMESMWKVERDQLIEQLPSSVRAIKGVGKYLTAFNADERLQESMNAAESLRMQIEQMRNAHESDVAHIKVQLESTRKQYRKENLESQKKLKELQEQVKIFEIDRRNMLSAKDNHEQEYSQIKTERDELMSKLYDAEIRQLANKYKLDKIGDVLTSTQTKIQSLIDSGDVAQSASTIDGIRLTIEKAQSNLESVRDDMAKTRELQERDNGSYSSVRSSQKSSESKKGKDEGDRKLSEYDEAGKRAAGLMSSDNSNRPYNFLEKQSSSSSDLSYNNWQERIADLRSKRSPSPSPRKMTAYPEAPPNIVINKDKSVEYNQDGRRVWIQKPVQRSASHDPKPQRPASGEQRKTDHDSESLTSTEASRSIMSESLQHKVPTNAKEMVKDAVRSVFASGTGSVLERRKLFADTKKSKSQEPIGVTTTAKQLHAVGIKMMVPGMTSEKVSDQLRQSVDSIDLADAGKKDEKRSSRTSLVTGVLDRIRGRSKSREPSNKNGKSTTSQNLSSSTAVTTPPATTSTTTTTTLTVTTSTTSTKSSSLNNTSSYALRTSTSTSSVGYTNRYASSSYTTRPYTGSSSASYRANARTSSTDYTSLYRRYR